MAQTQIYRNEYAVIEARHEDQLIHVIWLKHASGEPARQLLLTALEYARTYKLTHWLFDMRKLNYITIADQCWTVKEFFFQFDTSYYHRIAGVASPENIELLPETFMNNLIQQNNAIAEALKLNTFLDKEVAEYWLLS